MRVIRSRDENVETVVENMVLFVALMTKNSHQARERILNLIKTQGMLFQSINKFCERINIPSRIFFDVMFSSVMDKARNYESWSYPYLSFLGNETAQHVFMSRMAEYKRRLGARDNIYDFVQSKSIANLGAYFGDSYELGYWSAHRFLDGRESFTMVELFEELFVDQVFTGMFIVTHPAWRKYCFKRRSDDVVKLMRETYQDELGLLSDAEIAKKFQAARTTKRDDAQKSLEARKDSRWQTIWKMLG